MDSIFINAAKMMTEQDFIALFAERVQAFQSLEFLDSLDICLAHAIGREYFDRYLNQTFCGEFVVFLKAFDDFKQVGNNSQRFEKARDIFFNCFHSNAHALIEISKLAIKKV